MAFRYTVPSFVAVLAALLFSAAIATADESSNGNSEYLNVYGEALQPCSYDGMALTGYTRSGYCVDQNDDSGSHHVCIDLSSLGGGNGNDDNNNNNNNSNNNNQNFCDVTGQSDWCSSEDMPCHEDPDTNGCPVTNWCVCQWAFASYIKGSEGCENIQTVVCESINQQALLAYQKMTSQRNADVKYQTALECLVDRCGLDASHLVIAGTTTSFFGYSTANGNVAAMFVAAAILVGALTCYAYLNRKGLLASKTIQLNEPNVQAICEKTFPVNGGESKLL
jgi:uncharacterized protein (DUF2237 family)